MDSPNSENPSSTDADMTKPNTRSSTKAIKDNKLPTVPENQIAENVPIRSVQPLPQNEGQNDEGTEQSAAESYGSASSLCGSNRKFNSWAQKNNVIYFESKWTDKEFTDFMNQQKYPAYIKSGEIITSLQDMQLKSEIEYREIVVFDTWRTGLVTEENEDPYAFKAFSPYITGLWISMLPQIDTPGNEATYRTPIDMLIELAFQIRLGAGQLYRKEMELALPGEPEVIIADGIATKAVPKQLKRHTQQLQTWNFSWSWNYSREALSVITFVFEAKVDELQKGQRQVQMGLLSAQMQRRALCMKDGPVFGALLNSGVLRIYVSVWQKDQLAVRPVCEPVALDVLQGFFEAYFILCRIAEFQAQWLDKEFERWLDELSSQREKLLKSKIWRKERRTRSRQGSQAGGGSNVQEPGEGEPREDLEKVDLDDDEEVKCFKMAVTRDPFPKDGYSLTRKRLYVLTKMTKENRPSCNDLVSEWAQRTSACADEYTHMYSPEYDADFRDDTTKSDDGASTTVGESESNVGTLVEDNVDIPVKCTVSTIVERFRRLLDDMTMAEKKKMAAHWHNMTATDGKRLMDGATCSCKYIDATSAICCNGEVDGPSVSNQVMRMLS